MTPSRMLMKEIERAPLVAAILAEIDASVDASPAPSLDLTPRRLEHVTCDDEPSVTLPTPPAPSSVTVSMAIGNYFFELDATPAGRTLTFPSRPSISSRLVITYLEQAS